MDEDIVWIIDEADDLGTCRSSDLVTLHNRYAIRKLEEIEALKAELERQKAELAKFQECIYSNGCHDDAGKYHSLLGFTWDPEKPNRAVYHKEGE